MFRPRSAVKAMLVATLPLLMAACSSTGVDRTTTASIPPAPQPQYLSMYGPLPQERFPMPAMDVRKVDPRFYRQRVAYDGAERPGTVVVDMDQRFLYLVEAGGTAMRYGIGVGREGLAFSGEAKVGRKAEWPRWTPTPEMIAREPDRYLQWADGMEPGLTNPLGPRALYLHRNGKDTLFRIHGTSEPWSIGQAMSSGCVRMFNHDVIDLYDRVPEGARVVVRQSASDVEMAEGQTLPPLEDYRAAPVSVRY
jgi:lipoprotein-anchoring transpeptidase ErfK/SrfK